MGTFDIFFAAKYHRERLVDNGIIDEKHILALCTAGTGRTAQEIDRTAENFFRMISKHTVCADLAGRHFS